MIEKFISAIIQSYNKLVRLSLFLIYSSSFIIIGFYTFNEQSINKLFNYQQQPISQFDHILEISTKRINKLFYILHEKEKRYGEILNFLGLPLFDNVIKKHQQNKPAFKNFTFTSEDHLIYLKVVDNRVRATEQFVSFLYNVSNYSLPLLNRANKRIKAAIINDDRPVVLTAGNSKYYGPLQNTIYHLHKNLPGYEIIVYDLGFSHYEYKMTVDNCRCRVIKFNMAYYNKSSKHVSDLMTYAWKPIIIQETLKSYSSVLYMDSSIQILNDNIGTQLKKLKKTSMLTKMLAFKLNCYTNPLMYKWFGETSATYKDFVTIEANLLLFERSFLSLLLMKAWVTCALDESCIAPLGSNLSPCCGCHRYDQDALTVVNSFFYTFPKRVDTMLPAFALTNSERTFYRIKRRKGKSYFTQNAKFLK